LLLLLLLLGNSLGLERTEETSK
jgi:hypothetical protein